MFGVAEDVLGTGDFAGFLVLDLLQPSLQAVLAAVGFVGDHDDVAAIAQPRVFVLVVQQRELLHGGKDDAAGFAGGQHLAEFFAAVGLFGRLLQQVLGHAELLVQLAVQFVAVGDHDQRRVLHRRLLQQLARVAAHGNALAAALRVPEHARLSRAGLHFVAVGGSAFADGITAGIGSRDRGDADGFADSVELMVTGDLFDERVTIVFKQDEVPHVIQKQLRIEEAANDFFQLVFQQRPIVFVLDRIPWHEPFFVGRQRTDSRCQSHR